VELHWANYAYRYTPQQGVVNISITKHQGSKGDVRRGVGEKSVYAEHVARMREENACRVLVYNEVIRSVMDKIHLGQDKD
jgi:hypothetical protein